MEGGWWVQERLGVPRMSLPVGSRGDSCTVLQQQSALNVGPGSLSVIGEMPGKCLFWGQLTCCVCTWVDPPEVLTLLRFGNPAS